MEKILLDHGFVLREDKWRFTERLFAITLRPNDTLGKCQIQVAEFDTDNGIIWGFYVNGVYVIDIDSQRQLTTLLNSLKITKK